MGNPSILKRAVATSIVLFLLFSAPAVAQEPTPTLVHRIDALYFSDGALVAEAPEGVTACGTPLMAPATESTSSFQWNEPPVQVFVPATGENRSSSYHATGTYTVDVAYTAETGEPVTVGMLVTVRVLFGSDAVGESTVAVAPGPAPSPTRHEIQVAPDNVSVAAATAPISVQVVMEASSPVPDLPIGVPVQNVAVACGPSLLNDFQVVAGQPGDGDIDGDGLPDPEDPDRDGDGVPNTEEEHLVCAFDGREINFADNPRLRPDPHDSTNNGYTDEELCAAGLDPFDPASVIPEPPGFPWGLLILLLILIALIAAVVFFITVFGKAAGIVVVSQAQVIVPKGEEAKYQLEVTNLRKKGNPINFQLSAQGQPEGWDARLDKDHVVLDPQGGARPSETVWLTVESPEHEEPESAVVAVRAVALTQNGKKDTLKLPARVKTITSINVPPDAKVPVKRGAPVKIATKKEVAGAGDVEKVIDVEGIGPEYAKRLEEAGITDTKQLLEADAKKLAKKSGISETLIVTWQQMSDLIRINGIAGQFAEVLVRAGVTSVEQLAGMEPSEVVQKVDAYLATVDRPPTKGKVTEKVVKKWIADAKRLMGPAAAAAAPAPAEAARPATGKEAPPAAAPAGEKPQLQVGNLRHDPAAFHKGQAVKSSVTVTNGGQSPHTLKLSLLINGELADAQTVNVKPGKSKDVKFKWTAQEQNKLNIRGELVPG